MDTMWQEYGIEELEKGMQKLFPTFRISVTDLMTQILQGDILGAVGCLLKEVIREMSNSATGIRNILIWLIVLGIMSALLIHFVEVFDKHQIADLSFYFIYLLMGVILLQCFSGVLETARETMENIVLFVRLMVPTFLLTVGVASGPVTVGAGYQLMLLLIYGTEKILLGVVLPLIYSYCLLTMINGIWVEEKLALLADLLEKLIGWILKASLGVVTGISLFQSLITPVVDSLKNSAVEKAVSVLPGIGNAADGVLELALGSAVVIRNSVGVLLLLLLVAGCAVPLLQICSRQDLSNVPRHLWESSVIKNYQLHGSYGKCHDAFVPHCGNGAAVVYGHTGASGDRQQGDIENAVVISCDRTSGDFPDMCADIDTFQTQRVL